MFVAAAASAQAVAAVVRGSFASRRRYSAHVISDGILHWYRKPGRCPRGISTNAQSVREWSLRNGQALRKLVAWEDSKNSCCHELLNNMGCLAILGT